MMVENGVNSVVRADRVSVRYGDHVAVREVSLTVGKGEVVGIVGRNGAGKTSLIECLVGLRARCEGSVEILGVDPAKDRAALAARVGVQLQESVYPTRAKLAELCALFSSFYPSPLPWRELIDQFGLSEKVESFVSELSGGQKQKLSLVLAMLGEPDILFLDELTTGLDPAARRDTWSLLREINRRGQSIVLSSHFMDEVEALCDRVIMLEDGAVKLEGTVEQIIERCQDQHRFILNEAISAAVDVVALEQSPGVMEARVEGRRLVIVGERDATVQALEAQGVGMDKIRHQPPNLEDAFLRLLGTESGVGRDDS